MSRQLRVSALATQLDRTAFGGTKVLMRNPVKYQEGILVKRPDARHNTSMDHSLPLLSRKPPTRAVTTTSEEPELDAVLKEVRRLRAALAIYRRLVDKLLEEKAA